jgi:hypothetical protein
MDVSSFDWSRIGAMLLIIMLAAAMAAGLLVARIVMHVRRFHLPDEAGLRQALRAAPLAVVVLLDVLDFGFDILAAPLSWTLLGYLGLGPLRALTVIEALIPGTQLLPTMTLAWLGVRLLDRL